MAEKYNQEAIDALVNSGRAIPGQSLTNEPDQSYAWENPPEFTNFRQALNYITSELLEEDVFVPLMKGVGDGVPITDIALQILQTGFQQGKWNPDLLVMLLEPTVYTLMAMAEKSNIQYRINGDDEQDLDSEDEDEIVQMRANNLKKYAQNKIPKEAKIPAGGLPQEIIDNIKNVEVPESLLDRKEPQQEESLLAKGEM
jgi:hypothetical protein